MKKIIIGLIAFIFIGLVYATEYQVDEDMNMLENNVYNGTYANFTLIYMDGILVSTISTGDITGINTDGDYIDGGCASGSCNLTVNMSNMNDTMDLRYRADDWNNFTGIPTATPSNGDVTHLSTANHIYDYIASLNYKTLAEIVANVGNWSADKSSYYLKTEIDTQGEVETIWGVTLATDTEVTDTNTSMKSYVDAQDTTFNDSISITESQVYDADWWDADGDITADEISESKVNFSTACAAGNHYYLNGNDLACEVDDDTTYTAEEDHIYLESTTFKMNTTVLNSTIDSRDSDTTYSDLSEFNDDLGDRGYTHLTNFSDDLNHVEDNESWNETYADTLYRAETWNNFTGIPTATPSDGDTTHLSTADQIRDYVIALDYKTLSEIVNSIGNHTADIVNYYLKTEIDTQGEVETIWGVTLSTDTERTTGLAAQDACSEITGCVENAVTTSDDTVNSTELDGVCSTNDKILKRVAGTWSCVDESGTIYYNHTGLGLNASNYFSILLAYMMPQSCNDGEIAEYNSTSGGWDCAIDNSAASGMASWVLAASDTAGTESITDGETVTFADDNKYLNATRSTNTVTFTLYEEKLNETIDARDSDTTYTFAKDLVGTAPVTINGGTNVDNIIYGADADVTIAVTLLKDLVAGDGLNGGANDVLVGADADVSFTFDCSEVISTGIQCSGEDLQLNTTYTGTLYQPLEATLTDIADGTITENLVNTANPWADNEVSDTLTASTLVCAANQDIGAYDFRALSFTSDVATGTVPFTVASTTMVSNLNVSYANISYDLSCTDCISGTEISELTDADVSNTLTVTGYMQDADIDTFTELQSWVSDKTLVNEEDIFTIDANWVNTANPWDISTETNLAVGNGITITDDTLTVVGGTCITADAGGQSVTADCIGDTQLAYNTGQHLTSTSNPTHNNMTITDCIVFSSGGRICDLA